MMSHLEIALAPSSTIDRPYALRAGKTLEIALSLKNLTHQTLRLQVEGWDLPADYFTIHYPKVHLRTGVEVEFNSLELAPHQTDQVTLELHPPLTAAVGLQTLQLNIKADLEADLSAQVTTVFVDILPVCDVAVTLEPASQTITGEQGIYQIAVANYGATPRHLTIQARSLNRKQPFSYQVDPAEVHLEPHSTVQTTLSVSPRRGGGRSWRRKKQVVAFAIGAEDHDGLPLPPRLPQGELRWYPQPRSLWKLGGLLGLGMGGAIALIAGYRSLLPRPQAAAPQVINLAAEPLDPNQQPNTIRLRWRIQAPEQLKKVVLTRLSIGKSAKDNQQIKAYYFEQGTPVLQYQTTLKPTPNTCQLETSNQTKTLVCAHITKVPDTQHYRFQVQTFGQQSTTQPTDTRITEPIAVAPVPTPKILTFFSPNTTYSNRQQPNNKQPNNKQGAASIGTHTGDQPILLNWDIANAQQIKELRILNSKGKPHRHTFVNGKLPPTLAPHCTLKQKLVCQRVPTTAKSAGSYLFKLEVIPKQAASTPQLAQLTGPITIKADPLKLVSLRINGEDVQNEYTYDPRALGAQPKLELSWALVGGEQVQTIISTLPGLAPTAGKTTFNPLFQEGRIFLKARDQQGQTLERTVALKAISGTTKSQRPSKSSSTSSASATQSVPALTKATPRNLNVSIPRTQLHATGRRPARIRPNRFTPARQAAQARRQPKISGNTIARKPTAAATRNAAQSSASKPVRRPQQTRTTKPTTSSKIKSTTQANRPTDPQSLAEANAIMRGLVKARNQGAIRYNGDTWRKTQDAVILLRRGYSRTEAARRAGLPLWKLDTLVKAGR